jgi:hypothetical protein
MLSKTPKKEEVKVTIKEPNFKVAKVRITGENYVQNRFSSENREKMAAKQREGSAAAKTRRAKPPKDFEAVYRGSMHVSQEGWVGIPATAIRNAMIDACRLTEFDMLRCKMCIFIVKQGLDRDNLEPLIKINGKPKMFIDRVKIGINQTDLAARAIFEKWSAEFEIEWDADVFSPSDVINLLARAGRQVGIGAGRPLSKTSGGTGKGQFRVEGIIG